MNLVGTVVNGAVILDNGQSLPEGARVEVQIVDQTGKQATLADKLLRLAGTVEGLPPDLALNHDHYLHGHPKK